MQRSNRNEIPQTPSDWVVSPMPSEASTLSTDTYCTVSPPPYTPTDATSLASRCADEKDRPEHVGGIRPDESISQVNANRFNRYNTAADDGSSLPEVVYSDLPEVVPSVLPEVTSSTLPQAAHSDLPQVVSGPDLPLVHSSLPEATTGLVVTANNQEVMTMESSQTTVTPLHLLGDQSEFIDCPFCEKQTKTRVKKKPSNATQ
ncbi:hypothetical protein G7Z17_g3616 [Cylindrodendrum hubeiense]|uniref:LITAF domain-containing protein n=1 Tax=Cylindrodendrum hubeiense TaxID=595255 RepID=A0A9P5HAG3_9HYPO|nr:hypothetical protein G7Z17_g3616 [Cylindrodendrum hubeiense]